MEASTQKDKDKHGAKDDLKVTVSAPRAPKPKSFKWSSGMMVSAAAAEAAAAFGYTGGQPSLVKDGSALPGEVTLKAAGVHDKDELTLLDTGGGV